MPGRLICLRGALEHAAFLLEKDGGDWTIGRDSSNRIELPDLQASRSHAVLRWHDPAGWQVEDLVSTNGTEVNGKPVDSRVLVNGDHLAIGNSLFLFLDREEEGPGEVLLDPEQWRLRATVELREKDAWLCQPAFPSGAQNHVTCMLQLATTLHGWQSLEGLQREVLRLVLQSVPADRGAILALDPDTGEPGAVYGWRRLGGSEPVAVSRFVLQKVFRDRAALLGQFGEDSPAPSKSVLSAGIQSLIAAPMVEGDAVVGLLYLDTLVGGTPLTQDSLQFAAAAAAVAAQPLESARRIDQLQSEKQRLETDLGRAFEMIGDSPAMQKVYQALRKIAPTASTVLILGETGSGKELAARAVHRQSPRAKGPFVAINCAAIAENLLESELFGHERGAFTGATAQKRGKLELAHTGTLFLDEVGELPLNLQSKLLRALQEREFERVGGTRPVQVDFRLVTATNRDLQTLAAQGKFRADLYYRLNVVSVRMPPLRERGADAILLATYFLTRFTPSAGRVVRGFSPRAKAALLNYDWPGNVRELQNAIERAVVLGNGEWIEPDEFADEIVEAEVSLGPAGTYHAQVLRAKQAILKAALAQYAGSYLETARVLGIHVKHLHRLMKAYGLKDAGGGPPAGS